MLGHHIAILHCGFGANRHSTSHHYHQWDDGDDRPAGCSPAGATHRPSITGTERQQQPAGPRGQSLCRRRCADLTVGARRGAGFGLHKISFATSLATRDAIGITTPDNRHLSFRPAFLAYYDTSSGKSVLLGIVRDSEGEAQLPGNVAIYQDAFGSNWLAADLQYICKPNSLEQNIILRQRPPDPKAAGLNPDTTRLEMWTEWFDVPPVRTQTSPLILRHSGNGANAVVEDDSALDFGTMKIIRGRAFNLNGKPDSVPVAKQWVETAGKKFLVEEVDYDAIKPGLESLAMADGPTPRHLYANREQMIHALAAVAVTAPTDKTRPMQLAHAANKPAKGVVLDFTIIDSIPLPAGAIEWWPAGGNCNDVVGGYNGTLINGAGYAAGEVGQGFHEDGVSSSVKIPSSADPTGPFTIEFWMKADPSNPMTTMQGLVVCDYYGIEISPGWRGNNGVNFFISPDGGTTWNMTSTPNGGGAVVSSGAWHHIAATYDGTNMQLYVDGQAWGAPCASDPAAPTPAGCFLTFGSEVGRGCYNRYFNGTLDEVTIYNRALSPSEIAAIYNAGGAGKDNPECVTPPANAVGWWAGDGNAADLVNTNNGVLEGNATCSAGEVGQAFDLDGDNSYSSYVEVPDSDLWAFGSGDFTIEGWVNLRSLDQHHWWNYPDAVLAANDEGPYDVNKWIFGLFNGTLTLLLDDPVNGPVAIGQAPFQPALNTWYHVALTRQGTTFTTYVNGAPIGTDTSSAVIPNANAPLTMGQAEGIGWVNGLIDEVTIYNRALSGSEIAAIYSAGGAGKCKSDVNANGIPDWWEWKYFGNLDQTDPNASYDGINSIGYDYQNGIDPNVISFYLFATNTCVNTSLASVQVSVTGGVPSHQAILVNSTNFSGATWTSYTSTNLTVNLGSLNEGDYAVWVGLKGLPDDATQTWHEIDFTIDTTPPVLVITNPATPAVGIPLVQVQGYAGEQLGAFTFDVSNATGVVIGQQGIIMSQDFDTNTWQFTTNHFQCFDITLTSGANIVTLHATDFAGNTTTSNLLLNLDYSTRTNPPVVQLTWPQDGAKVSGASFTLDGFVDDPTASIVAQIVDASGNTNSASGEVERTGRFWVDNLPLAAGANQLTLTVTDAAGHTTVTNLAVLQSAVTLTIDPLADPNQLWQPAVNLTGTISDSGYAVEVNGVTATVNGTSWSAADVPVTPGGVACFTATATADGQMQAATKSGPAKPDTIGLVVWDDEQRYRKCDDDTVLNWWFDSYIENNPWDVWQINHTTETSVMAQFWYYGAGGAGGSTRTIDNTINTEEQNPITHEVFWDETSTHSSLSGSWLFLWPDPVPYDYGNSDYALQTGSPILNTPLGCEVCGVENNYDRTTWDDDGSVEDELHHTYWRRARTTMALLSGGRAIPGREILHRISGWAKNIPAVDVEQHPPYEDRLPHVGDYTWFHYLPCVPYPAVHLLGSTLHDPDGSLYYITHAGQAPVQFTPVVPGSKFYAWGLNDSAYQLRIRANDAILEPDAIAPNANFCVGEKVNFSPDWLPCEPPYSEIVAHWNLPQKFVNEPYIYVYDNGTCTTYVRDDQLLHVTAVGAGASPGTGCWFVNGPGGSCRVSMNVYFPNGQVVFIQASGLTGVYLPSFSTTLNSPGKIALSSPVSPTIMGLQPPGIGIGLEAAVVSRFPGTAQFVQVFNGYTIGTDDNYDTAGSNWLDTADPYAVSGSSSHTLGDGIATPILTDAPYDACESSPAVDNETYTDYLQFMPDDGPGPNIFVTLATSTWTFDATATETSGVWSLVSNTPSPTELISSDAFPIWVHIWSK